MSSALDFLQALGVDRYRRYRRYLRDLAILAAHNFVDHLARILSGFFGFASNGLHFPHYLFSGFILLAQ